MFFLFFCNAPEITVTGYALLQQEIALVFLVRFRCGLQRFFAEEKPLEQFSKLSLGGATIGAPMRAEIVKI